MMSDTPMIRFTDLEDAFPGLVAGITTRSDPDPARTRRGGELDFGLSTGGDSLTLSRRFVRLADELGFEFVAAVRQVHGAEVVNADQSPDGRFQVLGEGDGLISERPGRLLAVTVADCVPVFIVSPGGATTALLHAGWRGTAAGILAEGIRAVVGRAGCAEEDLRVRLGPCICGHCYEVGPEVTGEFEDPGSVPGHLDLRHVLSTQAIASGIREESVVSSIECTRCDSERLHSHRGGGGNAGRMAAFIGRMA